MEELSRFGEVVYNGHFLGGKAKLRAVLQGQKGRTSSTSLAPQLGLQGWLVTLGGSPAPALPLTPPPLLTIR